MAEQTAKKIILIVDDMPLNLAAIKIILQDYYDIRPAKSAKTALSMLNIIKADLILLDMEMPEMSGIECLTEIRHNPQYAASRDIPVIFVTSHSSPEEWEKAKNAGAEDWVAKPVIPELLISKVQAALAKERPS
ncbi:MAG: response regulator [Spirochaetales bacterium]|jgi:putative two-component system response regulator|nr:response regulator [Spirochaetales bacterium]